MAIYKINDLLQKHNTTIDKVTTFGSDSSIQNSVSDMESKKNLNVMDSIKKSFKDSSIFGEGKGVIEMVDGKPTLNKEEADKVIDIGLGFAGGASGAIKDKVVSGVKKLATPIVEEGATIVDDIGKSVKGAKSNLQLKIAKGNVDPRLGSSAERLSKNSNPLDDYNKYLEQSKNAVKEVGASKPIESVGEEMGNAFDEVIKKRSDVGKVVGDELKKNAKIKINIKEPTDSLLNNLKESGLSYNSKSNKLTSLQGTKFVPEEIKMLDTFVKAIKSLGENPSVKTIDDFIAKQRTSLKFTKGKSGVNTTTNAERIINDNMAKLKETLNPAVNKNKSLSNYWKANKEYSDLSKFIKDGSSLLGKETAGGNYAKDVGVAKSSVNSLLNQGKKDFMIKLEELTGYKALDKSVLALQAMADAGDNSATTLLKYLADGNMPVSKLGAFSKILNYSLKKGGEALVGTPEEQTRAFLADLLKK